MTPTLSTSHGSVPEPQPAPWAFPGLEALLPSGLPNGALSIIELGSEDPTARGDWVASVKNLVLGTLRTGRPVTYVQAGGVEEAPTRHLTEAAQSDRLKTHLEMHPPTVTERPIPMADPNDLAEGRLGTRVHYYCSLPTMLCARPVLLEHEAMYGPSLLVIDEVEHANTFWHVCVTGTKQHVHSPAQADGWRAADLAALAEQRPTAPTVVVWHRPSRSPSGIAALGAVARVRAQFLQSAAGSTSANIRNRLSVLDPWSSPRSAVISHA